MITPTSRVRLTAGDFDFIVQALAMKESDRVSLETLLLDSETRDEILDHSALADAILQSPERLTISQHLFFYVMCRRVLKDTAVSSREASDFVASLLEAFSRMTHLRDPENTGQRHSMYLTDMMELLAKAGDREAFLLRSHMANYSLFVSGMFVENLEARTRRGAPDISFYEGMGGMNYRVAAEYRDAKRFHLTAIYEELARGFHEARVALNDLANRLLHVESPNMVLIGG